MENTIQKFINEIEKAELKTNSAGTQLNQIQRNKFKQKLVESLKSELENLTEEDIYRVEEGIAIQIVNEKFGVVPIVIDVRFKNLDFDAAHEADVFEQKQILKLQKAQKTKANKKAKIKRDNEIRQIKIEKEKSKPEKKGTILRGIKNV